MASKTYIHGLLANLPSDSRAGLNQAFDHVLDSWRVGRCTPGTRAENGQLYVIEGTTHATPDTEFSIVHGLPSAPYLAVPILCLEEAGAQLVPLTVTRPADTKRVYLASSVADAPFRLLIEG